MPPPPAQHRSVFSRFTAPYTFSPDLSLGEAMMAIGGCLTRIFGACFLFAVWGGVSAIAWSGIESHFWRVFAILSLVLLFLGALALLMLAVSALEGRIASKG